MPDFDPSVFDVDPLAPDAKARMAALVQLLGQQQQGNVMGAMGGTLRTGMQRLGQGMEQQAQQQTGMLQGAPAARLKLAMENLANEKAQRAAQYEQDPESGTLAGQRIGIAKERQAVEQAGPQQDLGGKTPGNFGLLTKRSEVQKFTVNPVTGATYDVRTGEPGPGGQTAGAHFDKRLPPMQAALAKDLDPNNFRSGVLKGNQERANAADRLLTLAVDPLTGGPANLTPQQMSEVSTSLATLLGGGGSSEGSRHELTPYTKGRTLADLTQWWTDNPQGAGQQGFVKQMIDTARRERAVAEGQIKSAQAKRLSGHLSYLAMFPEEAKAQLESFGFNPEEVNFKTGKYSPAAAAAPPGKDDAALQWAKANPTDPRAAKILKLAGGQ